LFNGCSGEIFAGPIILPAPAQISGDSAVNRRILLLFVSAVLLASFASGAEILTPKPPETPRINGARVFGVRPESPFLFTIPATGDEPITVSARGLPDGLSLDSKTGRITGKLNNRGEHKVMLTASNSKGKDTKPLLIKVGDDICLTPPMGWNSWNCFAGAVDAEKVLAAAHAMVDKGLIKHGWTYINIDDTWQGKRGGKYQGLQGNEKFPDMQKLCDEIHALGLKPGIYSTPWVTSYATFPGGSAMNPEGTWEKPTGPKQVNKKMLPWAIGKFSFASQDAQQWADWGFDYLKYDWSPNEVPETEEMLKAIKDARRDIVLSLSNNAPFKDAAEWARLANAWRTTGDITDNWQSMSSKGFGEDNKSKDWSPFSGPGHWNDPDMLVVGMVGWGPKLHPTKLTPDEQYTHITLWSLLASPLLIGCDMTQLDDFTLGLLTNDEVLAVSQDSLGKQATHVKEDAKTGIDILARPLSDGTMAVGLFNRGRYEIANPSRTANPKVWKLVDRADKNGTKEFNTADEANAALKATEAEAEATVNWSDLKLSGSQAVRDLWRQKDLGKHDSSYKTTIPFHGAVMLKIGTPSAAD
jgi:alpha-galactosidase